MHLEQIEQFQMGQTSWKLEQYRTPPLIAAQMMNKIMQKEEDLSGMIAGDFGCGTGMISAGLICAGVEEVQAFEIVPEFAVIAKNTISEIHEDFQFDVTVTDLKHHKFSREKVIDIVVMNPPFGTKDQPDEIEGGIDTVFLRRALKICSGPIYSLHKSATRDYLSKFAEQNDRKFHIVDQDINFPLPKTFKKYHKKDVAYTKVDFVLFAPK